MSKTELEVQEYLDARAKEEYREQLADAYYSLIGGLSSQLPSIWEDNDEARKDRLSAKIEIIRRRADEVRYSWDGRAYNEPLETVEGVDTALMEQLLDKYGENHRQRDNAAATDNEIAMRDLIKRRDALKELILSTKL